MTWKSKIGQQQAVLDHIWYWLPTLQEVKAGVEWQEDSRFDHAIKWAEFDGNDVGFSTLSYTTQTPFFPKLKLSEWKDQKEEVLERGGLMKSVDPLLETLELLSHEKQELLWKQLGQSLAEFRTEASAVTGETKEQTGSAPMKLPGHSHLHREIHMIWEICKEIFAVQKQGRDWEQPALLALFRKLIYGLKDSPVTVPVWTLRVDRDSLLAETSSLVKQREDRVDRETRDKQNENFKTLAKRLQGSFNMGGARTMKVVTGKMGGSRGMWGVHTDHPD
eukprot:2825508-Rhodomonas_salina.2